MARVKRMLCLASSRKLKGRCIAGIVLPSSGQPRGWLRPVSGREHGEVADDERRCQDGGVPRVLDILYVPVLEPRPVHYQQENWLIDTQRRWIGAGRVERCDLQALVSTPARLWSNGHNTYHGCNDKVPLADAEELESSLRLIHVAGMTVCVVDAEEIYGAGAKRVQGRFEHCGEEYAMWITDPECERIYRTKPVGDYQMGQRFLTISLGVPHNNACYKLIAAVI